MRLVPIDLPNGDAPPEMPETLTVEQAAKRLDISVDTARRWIREDAKDGGNRVPGGRYHGSRYVVIRAVFDRAMRTGIEPERRQPVSPIASSSIAELERLAAELSGRVRELAETCRQESVNTA